MGAVFRIRPRDLSRLGQIPPSGSQKTGKSEPSPFADSNRQRIFLSAVSVWRSLVPVSALELVVALKLNQANSYKLVSMRHNLPASGPFDARKARKMSETQVQCREPSNQARLFQCGFNEPGK